MTAVKIQKQQLAGKTKLTAVTIHTSPSTKVQAFVYLRYDEEGHAKIPASTYNRLLGFNPRHGGTVTVV